MSCFIKNNCGCCGYRDPFFPNISTANGATGPVGPRGATGPTGPTGEAGTVVNENATIVSTELQNITTATPLALSTVLTNNNLTVDNNSITVTESGTYLVSFTVNTATAAVGADNVGIAINTVVNASTRRTISSDYTTSGSFVLNLEANDAISLVPTVTNATSISSTGGPSASLTVVRLA